ncbi:MAG: energy-coupling factor transporter ATPase [Coriobacteriia bacterium]|nr:energy-coupling factor transporter ATPase [Coriobacteriia bacterium]
MSAIEFNNASFTYDGKTNAFEDISLTVREGEFLCVLGGNGSGKSTLAKHINALLAPDSGTVYILGRDSADPANTYYIRSNAGMVFQNPDDQIVASVIENDVAFGPENLGVPTEELRERVTAALKQVGLQGFETRETTSLSGGQKQRVAVAGVLAMEPSILVFDEASAMLDPRGRAGLMRVCRELNEAGLTIILITHFMEEAALADRIVVLENGHIALMGTPDEVLTQFDVLERLSLEVPFAVSMSHELRKRGVPVKMHVDAASLEDEIASLLAGGDAR